MTQSPGSVELARLGQFFLHRKFGLVRCLNNGGDTIDVELFISPTKSKRLTLPKGDLNRFCLQEQTRVFVQTDNGYRTGRVIASNCGEANYQYIVQFPNNRQSTLPEQYLRVRCNLSHGDPSTSLAAGCVETQYWHDRRTAFLASVISQSAACRGLRGIISSRVHLVPHQVEVARRVLEDHVQRYLLADEVGMGKTIEAGMILRHTLLTNAEASAWVVVPGPLRSQWKRELSERFFFGDSLSRVTLMTDQELPREYEAPTLAIIDEAHHFVSRDLPMWLDNLCDKTERVLLLSATPSLRDNSVLLRLLRLIDPISYGDVSVEELSRRVDRQEQIGIFVRGLRADAQGLLLRQRAIRAGEMFPNDPDVASLADRLIAALDDCNSRAISSAVGELRSHIADVYRIHQRLLRSRRRDFDEWFLPRAPDPEDEQSGSEAELSNVHEMRICDEALTRCSQTLEEYRTELAARFPPDSAERDEARSVYLDLLMAWWAGPPQVATAIKKIKAPYMSDEWKVIFTDCLAGSEEDREARISLQVRAHLRKLKQRVARLPKVVIFGSDAGVLGRLTEHLRALMGARTILNAREIDGDAARELQASSIASVLTCGNTHEEGLNLHFADAIIHLDLPFAPQRIEQRIGRVDRFGRTEVGIEEVVVLPGGGGDNDPWDAWLQALAQGFRVFSEPVADVHFALMEATHLAIDALFESGSEGLRSIIPDVRKLLVTERTRLDNEYALDRVLQKEEEAQLFFDDLEDVDREVVQIQRGADGWLINCLQLKGDSIGPGLISYRWSDSGTLLPKQPWVNRLGPGLGILLTADRQLSLKYHDRPVPRPLRLGNELIDAVQFGVRVG